MAKNLLDYSAFSLSHRSSQLEKETKTLREKAREEPPFDGPSSPPAPSPAHTSAEREKSPLKEAKETPQNMASEGMQSVLTLVNRLQAAATTLGDVAGGDKSLPSLWDMLPSIVVIGGQVG